MNSNTEDTKGIAELAARTGVFVSSATTAGSLAPEKTSSLSLFVWKVLIACASFGALLILYFFAPTKYGFYPHCLFYALTGLSCPGCGSLRAMHSLLHGHWAEAFHYNPLLIVSLPVIPAALISYFFRVTTGRRIFFVFKRPFWIWLLVGVAVAFSILRNLPFGPLTGFRL